MTRALLLAACLGSFAAAPARASAQACCVGGGGQLGVVGRQRRAALSLTLAYQRALGSYSASGRYRPLRDASIDDVTLDLGGGVRLLDHRLEISASVPTRLQHRSYPGTEASTRVGLGDVFVGLSAMVVRGSIEGIRRQERSTWWPFVDLDLGLTAPTGRAPEASRDQNGADVTGSGHVSLRAGLRLSQFLSLRQIVTVAASYERGLARDVIGLDGVVQRYRPGDAFALRMSWLYVRDIRWSGGVFVATRFTGDARQDSSPVARSGSRSLSVGGLVSWVFDLPDWEATLSLRLDPFFDGPSKNLPQVGPRLGLMVKKSW